MTGLYVGLALRLFVAIILIAAAVAKVGRGDVFAEAIARFELLPERWVVPVASLLPGVELLLGLALAVGVSVLPVAVAVAVLLAVFGAAIAINLMRGRRFDCGCGLRSADMGWGHVARNVVLAALALGVAFEPVVFGLTTSSLRHTPPIRELLAVPLGVVLLCMCERLVAPLRASLAAMPASVSRRNGASSSTMGA